MKKENQDEIKSLTQDTWEDFVQLMNQSRITSQCWCVSHLMPPEELVIEEEAQERSRKFVEAGQKMGLLYYSNSVPVGWLSYGQRGKLFGFDYKDDGKSSDWVIHCFFFLRGEADQARQEALITQAVEVIASSQAAQSQLTRITAYPRKERSLTRNMNFGGKLNSFLSCGFKVQGDVSDSTVTVVKELGSRDEQKTTSFESSGTELRSLNQKRDLKIVK